MAEEECISFPALGEPAPDFEAETTQGPIKLSDLKGKWVVLFSHPADFTPVLLRRNSWHLPLSTMNLQRST